MIIKNPLLHCLQPKSSSIFKMKLLPFLFLLPSVILGIETTVFKRNSSLGAVFTPYTKFHSAKTDHSVPEIETLLELVSQRFQKITTYGMGTRSTTGPWNDPENEAEGFVAIAAAQLNQKLGHHAVLVQVGCWQGGSVYSDGAKKQVESAFDAASDANQVFNGTVTGVILTTHDGGQNLEYVLESIQQNWNRSKALSLEMGIRSTDCSGLSSGATAKKSNPVLLKIIQSLDFIICHRLPVGNGELSNFSQVVGKLGEYFMEIRDQFAKANFPIRVIGQTGWPSQEVSKENAVGSIVNMIAFWQEMGAWSKKNDFRIDVFTAFDEPWKEKAIGPVEGHYGWWMRIRNDSNGPEAFIEKLNYIPPAKSYAAEIGFGLLGGIIFLALIISIAFLYIRLKDVQSQLLTKRDIEEFEKGKQTDGDESTEDALRLPYDRSYEISKTKFIIDRSSMLGSGAFGTVYKGKLDGNVNDVAFKMTQSNCSANNLKSLLSEIKIMIHVGKHPNVVSIIGAYTGEMRQGVIMIAIELCDQGSLEKHLRANKDAFQSFSPTNDSMSPRYANDPTSENSKIRIQLEDLIKYSYHIACGMEHIASKNVIHADLAIRNVLLTRDGTAKITDFGLSRRMYEYTNYVKSNQEPLPWRWMAIESLQHMEFSTKSDVWAYGITLWEIFSLGDTPYPGLSWTVDFTKQLQDGLRMHCPQHATPSIYDKMLECWNESLDRRPSFPHLKDFFDSLLQGISTLEYQNLETTYKTVSANVKKSVSGQENGEQ